MAYSNIFYTIKDLNRLSSELRSFLEDVDREKRLMLAETTDVGYYWNDDQYRKFLDYMQNLSNEIDQCSTRLAKSNDKLDAFIFELLRDA